MTQSENDIIVALRLCGISCHLTYYLQVFLSPQTGWIYKFETNFKNCFETFFKNVAQLLTDRILYFKYRSILVVPLTFEFRANPGYRIFPAIVTEGNHGNMAAAYVQKKRRE